VIELALYVICQVTHCVGTTFIYRNWETRSLVEFVGGEHTELRECRAEVETIFKTRGTLNVQEGTSGVHNMVLVPVVAKRGVVGVLKAWDKRDPTLLHYNRFSDNDETVLQEFGEEIGRVYEAIG
jgi:hypothetical protein